MTLNQLRYFCTAARYHSITKAAKSLYVTQPAVSIAIRELEKEFSISLFTHTSNGLELTKEGDLFFRHASGLLAQSDEMKLQFSDPAVFKPTIRLGIPPMLSAIFFPDLMDAFHEEFPDIYLELSEYASVRACDMVQEEQLDIGLVNMEMYRIDQFSNLVLADDKLVFCVHPSHHLAGEKKITAGKIDGEAVILSSRDAVQNNILNMHFRAQGVQPRVIMHSNQITTILKFLRQGSCGCFFFSSMLPFLNETVGIPMEPEVPVKIGLVWKKGKYISSYMQDFIGFCERYSTRSEASTSSLD